MAQEGDAPKVEFRELTKAATKGGFACGAREVDTYFRKEAWGLHDRGAHRVTCAHLAGNDQPVGFYSLGCVTERIDLLKGHYLRFRGAEHFPCLQLAWIGVQRPFQGRSIGKLMVGEAIATFAEVGRMIGIPQLILAPLSEEVKPFYSALGFVEYDNGKHMYLPLQAAIEATAI